MEVAIIGSNGFVGKNLTKYLKHKYFVKEINIHYPFVKNFDFQTNVVIHLSGKAHDLRNNVDVDEYYLINTEFAIKAFNDFLKSDSSIFIILSSVKAVADELDIELTEDYMPNPYTHYGKSKLFAEQYILSKEIPNGKRVYILRPCMIHGPGNKGNLNLLYKIVSKGLPWPLGKFENKRSFCSIDNLCFIIRELIENEQIPSCIYNIADDEPVSTNELINLISLSLEKKTQIWNIPQSLIKLLSKLGDVLRLPLNSERLNKLTETYIVSNNKIIKAINKPLPISAKDGLIETFNSFNNNA